MPRSFLPDKDAALLAWSLNFSSLITATPSAYGLVAGDATAFSALHTAFATALTGCDPGVRNKAAVAAKNDARDALKTSARLLAQRVSGTATVTDAQKIELGLTVRSAPSPIPAPVDAPALDIVSVSGRTVKVRLHDATDPSRRGRPAGVDGAAVFSYVGTAAPTDATEWKFEGNTTRTSFDVVFPESVAAGAQVWVTAFWFNPRAQSGPACAPIGAFLQYGTTMAA